MELDLYAYKVNRLTKQEVNVGRNDYNFVKTENGGRCDKAAFPKRDGTVTG